MIKQGVILAAGGSTHLKHLTRDRTKAMLPVVGKPLMVRVMDRIREAGITRFVVVINENEGGLASYLSGSWYPNVEIKYVLQTSPKGTADALDLAAKYIEEDFILAAVDNLPPPIHVTNLIDYFQRTNCEVVLSLVQAGQEEIKTSADVTVEGERITSIVEKPATPGGTYAAFMVYACKHDILQYLKKVRYSARGEKELASAIQELIKDGKKIGYLEAPYRFHLVDDIDLLSITRGFLEEGRDSSILSDLPGSVTIIPPVRIDPGVSIGHQARIGPYVYLENGCTVGEGAKVADTVVLRNATIPKGEVCRHQIVTRTARISHFNR